MSEKSIRLTYDVAIVGSGPAGMFCAHRLVSRFPKLRIALIDKGPSIAGRTSLLEESEASYPRARPDLLISGAGGAGLFSDGKLVLSLKAGGKISTLSDQVHSEYIEYIEGVLVGYDGSSIVKNSLSPCCWNRIYKTSTNLSFKSLPVRHFSTELLPSVVTSFFRDLSKFKGLDLLFCQRVLSFSTHRDHLKLTLRNEEDKGLSTIEVGKIVFAVGKEGSHWLSRALAEKGVGVRDNRVYVGVRVETKPSREISGMSGDPKLFKHFPDGTKIKTHCFCHSGEVLSLQYSGLPVAGSHSPTLSKDQGRNTVFGVLLGSSPQNSFSSVDCLTFLETVRARTQGALLLQRYEDYCDKKVTTRDALRTNAIQPSASAFLPGDISSLREPMGFREKFLDFLSDLAELDADLITDDTLIYSPAAEWWMQKIETNEHLETKIPNIYVAGDGAGVSQGIMYAAVTGAMVADTLLSS